MSGYTARGCPADAAFLAIAGRYYVLRPDAGLVPPPPPPARRYAGSVRQTLASSSDDDGA